jgi:hypothetical protein
MARVRSIKSSDADSRNTSGSLPESPAWDLADKLTQRLVRVAALSRLADHLDEYLSGDVSATVDLRDALANIATEQLVAESTAALKTARKLSDALRQEAATSLLAGRA